MDVLEQLQSLEIVRSDPEIMSGTLVFTGTRVPLKTFFDYLEGGEGLTEFLEDFPHLQTPVLRVMEVTPASITIVNDAGEAIVF